ncbi:MAG: bifunctional DNA primase/polymerase [Planctomycetota bacterium]
MLQPNGQLLEAALAYARLGYPVFPCAPGGKTPITTHGCKDATADETKIRAWWQQYPHANIGIATAGLVVVDVDGAENPWLADPPEKLSGAVRSLTPGGGRHHVFRQPSGRAWGNTTGKLAPKVDTRGNGGYILAPPSVVGGKSYRWADDAGLNRPPGELPEPPAWLAAVLDNGKAPILRPCRPTPASGNVEPRALAYLNAMPPAVSGQGGHNATYAATTALVHGFGISPERALSLLLAHYNPRCQPPWTEKELRHKVDDAATKPHDYPLGWLRDQGDLPADDDVNLSGFMKTTGVPAPSGPPSLRQLVNTLPALRKPVIEGLLREGETMNIIAASKTGKSWLVIDLALAVATGRPWLGMNCVPGNVLILDNELHGETSANRIPKVVAARGIQFEDVAERIYVDNLRGRLQDLFALGPYFKRFAPGRFKVVILDAFYRFLPMRADENDNGTMANLYNYLDSFADYLKCSFVLIHHTSKGNQSSKEVTDVGAGAGSQSRATDTHLVLRRHEEEDVVVMDAAVRSWPPVSPRCLRWAFPVWIPADDLDPAALRKEGGRKSSGGEDAAEPEAPAWTVDTFVTKFIGQEPKSHVRILFEAEQVGISSRKAARFLELAEEEDLVHRWHIGPRRMLSYATAEPPEDDPSDDRKRAAVEALFQSEPELSTKDVAERCGVSRQYVNRIRKGAN